MAKNLDFALPVVRYSRADFTSLRAWLRRVPTATILDLYYNDDDRELLGLHTPQDLYARLLEIRDNLAARAAEQNPYLSNFLQEARHSTAWPSRAVDALVQAADQDLASPRPGDPISLWFKPRISKRLKEQDCHTLIDLANLINVRGSWWYAPVHAIGRKTARVIERWFLKEKYVKDLIDPEALKPVPEDPDTQLITLDSTDPVPLARLRLSSDLDGSLGINRVSGFRLLDSSDDLQAVRAYLVKYAGREHTLAAYTKEIERFVLWCVLEQRKPLSSVLVADCTEYLAFLAKTPKSWIAARSKRKGKHWRPFASQLSPKSQKYAYLVLKACFQWLTDSLYLRANPWHLVAEPDTIKPRVPIQIDKALPKDLWIKLANKDGILDWLCSMPPDELATHFRLHGPITKKNISAHVRLIRAAISFLGDTGLRRAEATNAKRTDLKLSTLRLGQWELTTVGKRNKERTVPVSKRVVELLQAHWEDRGLDFRYGMETRPLLAPIALPLTESSKRRHFDEEGEPVDPGFAVSGLGRLVSRAMTEIADDKLNPYLDDDERNRLRIAAAHALRHTNGTLLASLSMPLDVVQRRLGHESLQTTTIYVQAEEQRVLDESSRIEQLLGEMTVKLDAQPSSPLIAGSQDNGTGNTP